MNKKNMLLPVMAVLLFFLSAVFWGKPAEAEEKEVIDSGDCGEVSYDFYDEYNNFIYFQADRSVKYRLYKDGTMVISGSGEMGDFDTWNDCCTWYRMKELMPWYDYRAKIRKVVVEDGVTTIGSAAFYGCRNLESIQWADSIKDIGNRSFYGCKSLESIPWTEGIERVGDYAFQKCTGLKEVRLPSYIKEWWCDIFAECTGLKKVYVDEDFKFPSEYNEYYGKGMFRGCTALEELRLPKDLTVIPSRFVEGCTRLKVFPIPDNVIYWGSYPPSLCKGRFVLPDSVQTLAEGAFADCSNLKELVLPEGLVYMGRAFYGCSSLKTLKIPESVTKLKETFYNCTGLEDIVIPNTVQNGLDFYSRNESVFEGCSNLKSVVLPDNMIYIGDNFFRDCSSLKKIKLPSKLKEIGWRVFYGCSSLTEIKIPDTVEKIGCYAFSGCRSLKEIDIPKGVDAFHDEAFYNCKNLESVTVRAKSFRFFGKKIFYGCKKLSGITTYAKNAKKFHIPYGTFDGVPKEVTVYVPKGSINAYKKWLKGTPGLKDIRPMQ